MTDDREIHIVGADKASIDRALGALGVPPMKAAPRSGRCVACGRALVPPPRGKDRDHSVCDDCFPDDMKEEWEGRSEDYVFVNGTTGATTALTSPPPSVAQLQEWMGDGGCECPDGCWTEPDGHCEHGQPSWLLILGLI